MAKDFLNQLYLIYFKYKNKKKGCTFTKSSSISSGDVFEGNNYIGGRVIDSYIGYGTYISNGCFFRGCKIGRYCSIAPDVKMLRGTHPINEFVSTSPAFYLKDYGIGKSYVDQDLFVPEVRSEIDDNYELVIGNDVWIGQQVLLRQGIHIGNGAVIGAGAVVTKDVPPYAVVAGVPAKIIRYRFDESIVEKLIKTEWWNKEESWIEQNAKYFSNIELLLEKLGVKEKEYTTNFFRECEE